jgi:hypothetical protein
MSALPEFLLDLQKKLSEKRTKAAAWEAIEGYFSFFGMEGLEKDLWQMLVGTLTSDEMDSLEKGRERHDLIFFYEYTLLFAEATYLLLQHHRQKHKNPS